MSPLAAREEGHRVMFRDLDVFGEFDKGNLAEGEGWVKFERVFTPREAW